MSVFGKVKFMKCLLQLHTYWNLRTPKNLREIYEEFTYTVDLDYCLEHICLLKNCMTFLLRILQELFVKELYVFRIKK